MRGPLATTLAKGYFFNYSFKGAGMFFFWRKAFYNRAF